MENKFYYLPKVIFRSMRVVGNQFSWSECFCGAPDHNQEEMKERLNKSIKLNQHGQSQLAGDKKWPLACREPRFLILEDR